MRSWLKAKIPRLVHKCLPALTDARSGVRKFRSFEEFDRFVLEINAKGDEAERIVILSNCYLDDPRLLAMPGDPFSAEYRQAVLDLHARISGRSVYDAQTMEHTPLDIEATVARPAPYALGGEWLGNYLESFGNIIRRLEVTPRMRVIEYGCGDAEISLHLARMGCDVTVVDIEPDYLRIVQNKAARLNISINTLCGDFMAGTDLPPFDRVFYYQAYHHALDHGQVLENMSRILKPDGFIVFGAEPVIDPDGPWRHAVPYPWGPRLDGLSLRAMRTHGWMELGFQEPYFRELLGRSSYTYDKFQSATNPLAFSITAKRRGS